ncbi:MAG TPA: hypothetical protein VMU69_20505 [Bradyrhizobium sp.]|nr:hypothetical protein [Bradyrhizobium sp.]
MPTVGEHRGVGIHPWQTQERIEQIVKPAIDAVLDHAGDADWQWRHLQNDDNPPESRLRAAAIWLAIDDECVARRRPRPMTGQASYDGRDRIISFVASIFLPDQYYYTGILAPLRGMERPKEFQDDVWRWLEAYKRDHEARAKADSVA